MEFPLATRRDETYPSHFTGCNKDLANLGAPKGTLASRNFHNPFNRPKTRFMNTIFPLNASWRAGGGGGYYLILAQGGCFLPFRTMQIFPDSAACEKVNSHTRLLGLESMNNN